MTQPKALSREELVAFCDAVEAILPDAITPTEVYQRALNRIDEDLGAVRRLLEPAADVEVEKWLHDYRCADGSDRYFEHDVRVLAASLRKQRSRETAEQVMRLASEAELAKQDAASLRAERGWVSLASEEPALHQQCFVLDDEDGTVTGAVRMDDDHWLTIGDARYLDMHNGQWWLPIPPRPLPTPPSDGGKEGA